jgi:5'-nucleotidase / UDP-sugar diphosphatase
MRNDLRWTAALLGTGLALLGCDSGTSPPKAVTQDLVILHTNDIHSYLMGASPEADYTPATIGDDATRGGMARLASAVATARAAAAATSTPVLLLDAGDFMMGTLFETISANVAPELAMMHALGYDATTIGNHELDWGPDGLAQILTAAYGQGVTVPIVASNMNFDPNAVGDAALQAVANLGVITTKLIKTEGSIKVGIFGLLGESAAEVAALKAPLSFTKIADASAQMVADLRNNDHVDVVVALSHSGIFSDGTGPDADLATAVPGIDVIVSGHSHDTLSAPVQIGHTLIVTAGCYTSYLGDLHLTVTKGESAGAPATVALGGYTLHPIDDQIAGDPATQTQVESYVAEVDAAFVGTGLTYDTVVGETSVDLPLPVSAEAPVGNLVTDAYRAVTAALQPDAPPAIAIEGDGQIRSDIVKGKTGLIWFADLFRVLPDGIGPDENPGYPLVTFYLNAKDLASGLEFDAAQDVVPRDFFLQASGLSATYDMTKPTFARVTGLALTTAAGPQPLDPTDTTTCYKVVTTNYVAGFLGLVQSQTGGLLSVTAKESDCATAIADPTTRFVDADPATDGVQELKGWQALLKYVSGFPDTNGDAIPDVPAGYGATQGRIVAQ